MHHKKRSDIMKSSDALARVLFAGIFSLTVLVACGDQQEPAPDAGQGSGTAASDDGSGAIKMPPLPSGPKSPGQELAAKIEVPDFYPSDGPIYPDTKPSKSFVTGNKINLMFGTEDSTEKVLDFMNKELPSLGWNNADVQRMGPAISIVATKPGRELTVLLSPVDSGRSTETTLIAVVITN
jgi:hypothetical protein